MAEPQVDLKKNNQVSVVRYDPSKGYPSGEDLYYECPLCHYWLISKPRDYSEAECECGHLSIDIDWGRFSVKDHKLEPALLRLSPSKS